MYKSQLKCIEESKPPSYFATEIIAMLERALNFAHTGNTRVLSRRLMDHFWLSMGIVYDGVPSISPSLGISTESNQLVNVNADLWPIDKQTNRPLTCSLAAIKFAYSEAHAQVRRNQLYIFTCQQTLPRFTFSLQSAVSSPIHVLSSIGDLC